MEIKNRKINDYEVKETLEAGIILVGCEVKKIATGEINLSGSRCIVKDKILLVGSHIPIIETAYSKKYEATRDRELLLKKNQIRYLRECIQKGYLVIPVRMYLKKKYKVEIAICRPLKKWDKREKEIEKHIKRYE